MRVAEQALGSEDAAFVTAMRTRPDQAVADAYRRHGDAVYGLARRLVADPALAEEVTQDIFVRLWRHRDRYDAERGSLRSYLLAQCRGRSVDVVRSEVARRGREGREAKLHLRPVEDLEHQVCDAAVAAAVRRALRALPDDERAAVALAYYGGQTYRAVAETLAIPEGTAKSRIRSGLRRLRTSLPVDG